MNISTNLFLFKIGITKLPYVIIKVYIPLNNFEWKGITMLPNKRLRSLQQKKDLIAQSIEEAERSPSPDATILRHLKKQKLEISEIMSGMRHDKGQDAMTQ